MELKFPSFSEYQSALQNPGLCFKYYPLADGKIEMDLWGLPRVRSGGFALTYQLTNHNRKMAVRCFYRSIPDRMQRYYAISKFIESSKARSLIPVRYLSRGIHMQGKFYPITYMDWVDAATIDEWLVKNHGRKIKMKRLAREFIRLVEELESLQIAHGDLSHRNILYDGKKAVLIDYDGMFVPSLDGKQACELGNPYFQHPGRSEHYFNSRIDRFSGIVIYLALTAISHEPELYRRYETGGEGLLFTRKDFLHPYQSAVLHDMEAIPELRALVNNFREICLGDIGDTPSLGEFIQREDFVRERSEEIRSEEEDNPRPGLEASQREAILDREGEIIQVVGKAGEVFRGKQISGKPHVFINFGDWKEKCFTIVLWDQPLKDFTALGRNPKDLAGKWISVTGLLTVYNRRPQISPVSLSEIVVLENARAAAERLGGAPAGLKGAVLKEDQITHPGAGRKGWVQGELPSQNAEEAVVPARGLDRPEDVVQKIDLLYKTRARKTRGKKRG